MSCASDTAPRKARVTNFFAWSARHAGELPLAEQSMMPWGAAFTPVTICDTQFV